MLYIKRFLYCTYTKNNFYCNLHRLSILERFFYLIHIFTKATFIPKRCCFIMKWCFRRKRRFIQKLYKTYSKTSIYIQAMFYTKMVFSFKTTFILKLCYILNRYFCTKMAYIKTDIL